MLDRIDQAQHTIDDACGRLGRQITIMEVCGTHTVSIFRSGIRSILPEKVKLLSGPGCPVCVTDQGYIDAVMQLADRDDCLIATYGDMIRVPGSDGSLETRASRGNVRVVLSSEDALQLARENPDKTVVFIAVGFETTTPATAVVVKEAAAEGIENFCILSGHKLVLPAMRALLGGMNDRVDAISLSRARQRHHRLGGLRGDRGELSSSLRGRGLRARADHRGPGGDLPAAGGRQGRVEVALRRGRDRDEATSRLQRIIEEMLRSGGWLLARSWEDSEEHARSQRAIRAV